MDHLHDPGCQAEPAAFKGSSLRKTKLMNYFDIIPWEANVSILIETTYTNLIKMYQSFKIFVEILSDNKFWNYHLYVYFPNLDLKLIPDYMYKLEDYTFETMLANRQRLDTAKSYTEGIFIMSRRNALSTNSGDAFNRTYPLAFVNNINALKLDLVSEDIRMNVVEKLLVLSAIRKYQILIIVTNDLKYMIKLLLETDETLSHRNRFEPEYEISKSDMYNLLIHIHCNGGISILKY